MKQTVKIKKIGLKKLDFSLHAQFHNETCDLVRQVSPEITEVPTELTDEWLASTREEIDLIKEPRATTYTRQMREKDAERTRTATFIFGIVRTMRFSPDAEQAEAARRLSYLIRAYVRMQNISIKRRTARIATLLFDLNKPEYAAQLNVMGLTHAVSTLGRIQEEYSEMSLLRNAESAERSGRKKGIVVRRNSDEIYWRVVLLLQFAYLRATTDAVRETIETLVNNLNSTSEHIDTVYKQSRAQRRAKRPKGTQTAS